MTQRARHFPEMDCFVLMPFGSGMEYAGKRKEADFVYKKIIVPAVREALGEHLNEVNIVREVDNGESGLVTKSIIQRIAEAPLVIVDITGHNPNVFFELGVRYALRRNGTILLRQGKSNIPFDITNYRCHQYDPFDDDAAFELAEAIRATKRVNHTDSPVFDVFPGLEVETHEFSVPRMPWREYKERIDKIRDLLERAISEKSYVPDAIVGITKGGAAFADQLTQRMPNCGIITLALWADRTNRRPSLLFDNAVNKMMLHGLVEHTQKAAGELRILLVDEVIASGKTYDAAMSFVQDELPKCHLRFMPLAYRDTDNYDRVSANLLWRHGAFKFDRETVEDLHLTDWREWPWGAEIRRN